MTNSSIDVAQLLAQVSASARDHMAHAALKISNISQDAAVLTISVAAELAGMHPQTLRQYDRLGLVSPRRTQGGGRRYCLNDVAKLQEIQRLSQEEGINLAGICRILRAEQENAELAMQIEKLGKRIIEIENLLDNSRRVFAATSGGDVVVLQQGQRVPVHRVSPGSALVVWRQESKY